MKRKLLGKSEIEVSTLGFGTLTLGPFQLNMPVEKGAELIVNAVRKGINLIDTARAYNTYPYVREALRLLSPGEKEDLHVISRSYNWTYPGMKESFEEAQREMDLPRISIYMLHEAESAQTIQGHSDAIRFLLEMKNSGLLGAVGISTHFVSAVRAAAFHPDIDVIFAILNRDGIGIMDGGRKDMEEALEEAQARGKGILLMKALGGGHLFREARPALEYARDLPFVHSTVLGMQDEEEIDYSISIFNGGKGEGEKEIPSRLERKEARRLFIEPWCGGCGECISACPFKALKIEKGKAKVDPEKCLLCSYCAGSCAGFCIKVI
jgi:uncharacterized protein